MAKRNGTGSRQKSAKKIAEEYEETIYCHEASLSGYTYDQIAALATTKFGRSIGREKVRRRLSKYRSQVIEENVAELRAKEVGRLDRYLVALDQLVLAPSTAVFDEEGEPIKVDLDDSRMKAIDRAVRIAERRAKLLGLDAPTQVEQKTTIVAPVDFDMEAAAEAHLEVIDE